MTELKFKVFCDQHGCNDHAIADAEKGSRANPKRVLFALLVPTATAFMMRHISISKKQP